MRRTSIFVSGLGGMYNLTTVGISVYNPETIQTFVSSTLEKNIHTNHLLSIMLFAKSK